MSWRSAWSRLGGDTVWPPQRTCRKMGALDNAYARLARADEHFMELQILHEEVCEAQAKATIVHTNPKRVVGPGEMVQLMFVDNTNHPAVPERCAILVGDVANNLRTALNYLIIQLAFLDSGAKGRNQFPIEETPEGFKGHIAGKRGFLIGVSPAHLEEIEKLQPYNGCNWTRDLGKISNFDKHTDLILVTHDQVLSISAATEPATAGQVSQFQMQVNIQPLLRITLDDGMPLITTLQTIRSQVSQLLDVYTPEFK